jgi:hypothetical protein
MLVVPTGQLDAGSASFCRALLVCCSAEERVMTGVMSMLASMTGTRQHSKRPVLRDASRRALAVAGSRGMDCRRTAPFPY